MGDNARAPYGNHSEENIKTFSEQAVDYLFKKGARVIIFACNTASSIALGEIKEKNEKRLKSENKKILGVLMPVAEYVAEKMDKKRVGVIGTKATINSKVYENEIKKLNPSIKVFTQACPLLVPLIEEGWHEKPEATSILKKYLRPMKNANIDTLILGCTHYPFMEKQIKKFMGGKVEIIKSGEIVAKSLKDYLQRNPLIEKSLTKNKTVNFITTDDPNTFKSFVEKNFGRKIKSPEKIKLS